MADSAAALRARLIGAWRLEKYTARSATDPSDCPHPMTSSPTGIIMYTPDGYMSAQLGVPASGMDEFEKVKASLGSPEEHGKPLVEYMAYSGPFHTVEEGGKVVLKHEMECANIEGWAGQTQVRLWSFEDDGKVLVLTVDPIEMLGTKKIPELKWRRMEDRAQA